MLYLDKIICLILSDNAKVKNKYVAKKNKIPLYNKAGFCFNTSKTSLKT